MKMQKWRLNMDVLQIPAFLVRQTDLVGCSQHGQSGKPKKNNL
jgi:3-deoxy-D-manno-octulosonic acid (KDO) 8-phosphate synthase